MGTGSGALLAERGRSAGRGRLGLLRLGLRLLAARVAAASFARNSSVLSKQPGQLRLDLIKEGVDLIFVVALP
ncbi:hypothetical protein TR74_09340 [Carbonactinospora thermoautotrophica]|uniref:Uncharacterized protein n=1 Tax=Carbonactinospora thermoautotrophica TaxID=1469144 RepID=A0A132NHK3_9ACTN|nr:hypothetical protein TR74_09340 [Carbonactinospora thermoautotrophica]